MSLALCDIMKTDFLDSPPFIPWRDPRTGVISYLLAGAEDGSGRAAPHQQSFYYTASSLLRGDRYYWFYCIHPPTFVRTLGVLDLQEGTLRHLPHTAFTSTSPMLDQHTGDIYWSTPEGIWQCGPHDCAARLVNQYSLAQRENFPVEGYATHLTLSADRKLFFIDSVVGDSCLLGGAPLDGSPIEIWQRVPRTMQHGLASPTEPDLFLIARDHYTDRSTGKSHCYDNRLWLIRRNGEIRPVFPTAEQAGEQRPVSMANPHMADPELARTTVTDPRAMHGHEWWSADGRSIYYIHYQTGIERVAVADACSPRATPELVWAHDTVSHAHTSTDGSLLVLDALPSEDPQERHVRFVNLPTGRSVDIVSAYPGLPDPDWKRYHVHPHPHFCGEDRFVCYTTLIAGGRIDVAFVRVSDLLKATM